MWTKFDKTLTALVVSGAVPIVIYLTGAMISAESQASLVTALTGFFVWLIPNKGA